MFSLEVAAEWGMPPWKVEEEASQQWIDRWLAWRGEQAKARKVSSGG